MVKKIHVKLFARDWLLVLVSVTFLAYVHIVHLTASSASGDLIVLEESLSCSFLCFAFFLFVSYYYADKLRYSSLDECVTTTKGGIWSIYGPQLGVLMTLNAIVTVTMLGYNLYAYFSLQIGHSETWIHIMLCILLYIFAVSAVAIILGMLIAMKLRRLPACLWMVAVVLVTSALFDSICAALYMGFRWNLYPIYEVISLYPRRLNQLPRFTMGGYSLLPDRVCATVFWLALLSLSVFMHVLKNRKKAKIVSAVVCGAVVVASFAGYLYPSSRFLFTYNPKSDIQIDRVYYITGNDKPLKMTDPEFEVTKYEITLYVEHNLQAKTTVAVDRSNLESYCFTLYHGYEVKEICDQNGEELSFTQEGDYIEVINTTGHITEITFDYRGDSPTYFAHSQGINLPGTFWYYPVSGYRIIYDTIRQGFFNNLLDEPVEFMLSVDYHDEVYSNLPQVNSNTFCGTSNACTVIAGAYSEIEADGITVVYPYLDTDEFNYDHSKHEFSYLTRNLQYIKENHPQVKRILIIPKNNIGLHETCNIYSDGTMVVQQVLGIDISIQDHFVSMSKRDFRDVYFTYLYNRDEFQQKLSDESGFGGEKQNLAVMLDQVAEKIGEGALASEAKRYMGSLSDERTSKEFLQDLMESAYAESE